MAPCRRLIGGRFKICVCPGINFKRHVVSKWVFYYTLRGLSRPQFVTSGFTARWSMRTISGVAVGNSRMSSKPACAIRPAISPKPRGRPWPMASR